MIFGVVAVFAPAKDSATDAIMVALAILFYAMGFPTFAPFLDFFELHSQTEALSFLKLFDLGSFLFLEPMGIPP